MRRRIARGLVTAILVAGCDTTVSEAGRFELGFAGLTTEHVRGWDAPYRVLAGARLCPRATCAACGDACEDVEVAASGPVSADGAGCFVADAPGQIEWHAGAPCDDLAAPADRLVMTVVGADEVAAEPVLWPDRSLAASDEYTVVGAGLQGEEPLPTPLRVVEGSQVRLMVRLFTPDDGHVVAWTDGAVAVVRATGRAPVAYPGPALELVTFAGSTAAATFAAGGGTWPLGQVNGVAASEARSLELAAAVTVGGEPALARAVVRDADGGLLFGLPVTWRVTAGELALGVDPELPGQDYVLLADECLPPERRGGPRSAVLEARHGELAASLELAWEGAAGEPDPAWERGSSCPEGQGCGCRSQDARAGLLGLLGLLLVARRRRAAALGVVMVGCGGSPPEVAVREVRALGALAWDPAVAGRDGGYSARVGDRSVWVFGDTGGRTPPGHLGYANNTSCATVDLDARDGLFPLVEHLDEEGYLLEFLPLTAEEQAYEQTHGDPATCEDACEGVALWPGPLVHDPERRRVLVMYMKLYQRPGPLDITVVGTSIAVWDEALTGVATRPVVAPGSDEPTLMMRDGEFGLATAALVVGEDLVAYACDGEGFDKPCRVGRVPLAVALSRDAWRFYAGDGGWVGEPSAAVELFQGAPMMSVHFNDYAGVYIAAYAAPAGNEIEVRTAPTPEGPWSDAGQVFHGREPLAGSSSYGGLMHPELARDGGRVEYLTYYLEQTGTIELVEVSWE